MTDRIYPSAKQPNGTTTTAAVPPPPAAKSHLHNPMRHPYRPTPAPNRRHTNHRRRFSCRRCCCLTCFWSILVLLLILLLAAIVAAAFYALYHPHRPAFSLSSLRISDFNLTTTAPDDTTRLTTKLNLTLSVKNPNKKLTFFFAPMYISVLSSSQVNLSTGYFTNFTNPPDAIHIVHTTLATKSQVLDADSVNSLKADLERKNWLPMKIVIDTMMGVKLEKLKMKKIGIRVKCDGIHGTVPKGKNESAVAKTSDAKCKVDLRIKILKWTF